MSRAAASEPEPESEPDSDPHVYAIITGPSRGFLVIEPENALWRIREYDIDGTERISRPDPLQRTFADALGEAVLSWGGYLQNFWEIPPEEDDPAAYTFRHGQPGVELRRPYAE